MPVEMGGQSPVVPPPKPTPEEQQEKGYKGVPFLKAEDIPITAFSPTNMVRRRPDTHAHTPQSRTPLLTPDRTFGRASVSSSTTRCTGATGGRPRRWRGTRR